MAKLSLSVRGNRILDRFQSGPPAELPEKNPLAVGEIEVTGDIETDDGVEAGTVLNMLRKIEDETKKIMGAGYCGTIVFATEEQYEAFLKATGWDKISDSSRAFIDGNALARLLGVELPQESLRFKSQRLDRKLVEQVGIIGE